MRARAVGGGERVCGGGWRREADRNWGRSSAQRGVLFFVGGCLRAPREAPGTSFRPFVRFNVSDLRWPPSPSGYYL